MKEKKTALLTILIVDDDKNFLFFLDTYLKELGHRVEKASDGFTALTIIKTKKLDLAIVEVQLPNMNGIVLSEKAYDLNPTLPFVFMSGKQKTEIVIQALRHNALDFISKPFSINELKSVLIKSIEHRTFVQKIANSGLKLENPRMSQIPQFYVDGEQKIIGISPEIEKIKHQIFLAVENECDTILIQGETGTGKEIVANQIHQTAENKNAPFITVSCPVIQETLFENELFGHIKGAFTGAFEKKRGLFELANNGTLFLDEISEIPITLQAKLLRVLETRKFRPVGGQEEIPLNIRIIAASNISLETLVNSGRFRSDLYYRLNVFSISLPPLREHPMDIIPLAEYFLKTYSKSEQLKKKGFSKSAQQLLLSYKYPGNIRELQNIIRRAIIFCHEGPITPEHLGITTISTQKKEITGNTQNSAKQIEEKSTILSALEIAHWNRREAAKLLGIPYSTLRFKIMKLRLK